MVQFVRTNLPLDISDGRFGSAFAKLNFILDFGPNFPYTRKYLEMGVSLGTLGESSTCPSSTG